MVIKVSMPCERSRSRAMALAARADGTHLDSDVSSVIYSQYTEVVGADSALFYVCAGVISMAITGDSRDRLEIIGDGVDPVRLVSCLRRKVGQAEILEVEEVKDKKPEEKKKPEEPKPPQLPVVVPPPPQSYPCAGGYYHHHHHPPPPMVVCEEPSSCPIM
jgi:hypothetical protein